jgi:LmbE family N-acetylglucosaminyl deacetylase
MEWIYLSPHLDDVALSCGGLVWEQIQAKDSVSIWTICAGDPPPGPLSPFAESLHTRWGAGREAIEQRRKEDIAACSRLGATYRHFSVPDCVYRLAPDSHEHLYTSEESLFGDLDPRETGLIHALRVELANSLPAGSQVVCPLSLGGHVDHHLTRAAASGLAHALWYYADYPYVLDAWDRLEQLERQGWKVMHYPISENGIAAWQTAVSEHASQISTFWATPAEMRVALQDYKNQVNGISLWLPPENMPPKYPKIDVVENSSAQQHLGSLHSA